MGKLSDNSMVRIATAVTRNAQQINDEANGPWYVLLGLEQNGGRWEVLYEDSDFELVNDEKEELEDQYAEVRIKTFGSRSDDLIDKYLARINHEEKQYAGR